MIPDEIWKKLFQLLAHNTDISKVFRVKQVCKRWNSSFSSAIVESTIRQNDSIDHISELKYIQALTINSAILIDESNFRNTFLNLNTLTLTNSIICSAVPSKMLSQMTKLTTLNLIAAYHATDLGDDEVFFKSDTLSLLVNLESLKIEETSSDPFKSLSKLAHLKNLDLSALSFDDYASRGKLGVNLEAIGQLKKLQLITLCGQEYFPLKVNELQRRYPHVRFRWLFKNEDESYCHYEGLFNDNNCMNGKGVCVYLSDGAVYEGEFKDHKKHGKGVYTWPDCDRYDGEFKDGNIEGKGAIFWSDGDRFEGEFKDGGPKFGIMYYANGNRYSGELDDIYKEGKGIMIYSNCNRYEGAFANDKRVGKGVFYYSNGTKVEGDESVFKLNEKDGTIEML